MIAKLLLAVVLLLATVTASPIAAQAQETPRTGGVLKACILGLNLFGDGLRDMLDPKLRGAALKGE